MALADEYDGLLIDLDGVMWIGREPVPGAVDAVRDLRAAGKRIGFVTNNPGRPPSAYVERLRGEGLDVADGDVVTAGQATAALAAERLPAGASAFVIGAPALHDCVADAGLRLVEGEAGREADAVVVSGHRGFDYEELLTATLALRAGARLFATSRDPTLPMPGGAHPGTGAILAAVETASGAVAEVGGKPEPHLFELALERLGSPGPVAMVGDRPSSDVAGGRRAGLATILVLSGATTREEAAHAEPRADHVVESLASLTA